MTDATKGGITLAVVLGIGIFAGLGIGWKLWSPKPAKAETYAPAVRQADGSLVLERKPMTQAEAAKVVKPPQLPEGAKLERQVQVVVQPSAEPSRPSGSAASPSADRPPYPPVRVDLALVKMPDDSRRVVASSPDGSIVGGVDIPLEPSKPVKVPKWAAGGSWNPTDKTYGAWIERDLAFLRVGADVLQQRDPNGSVKWGGLVRVGIRF